jgi:glycine betaine/proline transport system substrate-binding protein
LTKFLGAAIGRGLLPWQQRDGRRAESCKTVRFADVGWTDIQVTTGATQVVLEALGYTPDVKTLSVPVTYASLKNKDIDVFLGNWMPSMTADIKAYTDDKSVETIGTNLEGAG